MADEKLNTGPAENISPEAAEPISPLHGSAAIAKTQNWRRSIAAPCMRQAFLLFVRLCTCPCFSMMLFPRSIKAAST